MGLGSKMEGAGKGAGTIDEDDPGLEEGRG